MLGLSWGRSRETPRDEERESGEGTRCGEGAWEVSKVMAGVGMVGVMEWVLLGRFGDLGGTRYHPGCVTCAEPTCIGFNLSCFCEVIDFVGYLRDFYP